MPRPAKSRLRRTAWLAGAIAGALMLGATLRAAEERLRFGLATFPAPAGYTREDKDTVQTFVRVRERDFCMLFVYVDEAAAATPAASFDDAWSSLFLSGRFREVGQPMVRAATTRAGYRHLVGEAGMADQSGNRFVARLHLFPLVTRVQTIVVMANTPAALEAFRPEWEPFIAALAFPGASIAGAPGEPAATAGGGGALPPGTIVRATLTASAPISTGAVESFENIRYRPPAGWRVERRGQSVVLAPTMTFPGEVLQVMLLPGRKSSGTLAEQFAATWPELVALFGATSMRTVDGAPYTLDEPGRSRRGWEYLRGNGGMMTDRARLSVDVYLIRAGDRLERVVVVTEEFRANLLTLVATMNPAHKQAIRRFIYTLDFANLPSAPVIAPATLTKATSGAWGGSSMSFGAYKATFAVLFDDGTAFFGPHFPTEGLDGIDPSIEEPRSPRYWGRYTMNGDSGEIRMPYGSIPFRRVGRALEVTPAGTPHRFAPLALPTAGQLEGRWCLGDGQCLEFMPGGRFRDGGAVRVLEHATYDYPLTPERGAGTYAMRNHTLILRYDDGREFRVALIGVAGGSAQAPAELMMSFNIDTLVRR